MRAWVHAGSARRWRSVCESAVIPEIVIDALKRATSHTLSTHIGNNSSLTSESSLGLMDTEFTASPRRTFPMTVAPESGTTRRGLKIVRGACPHDCPDTCAMLYH